MAVGMAYFLFDRLKCGFCFLHLIYWLLLHHIVVGARKKKFIASHSNRLHIGLWWMHVNNVSDVVYRAFRVFSSFFFLFIWAKEKWRKFEVKSRSESSVTSTNLKSSSMLKIMKTSRCTTLCKCRQKRNHHSISAGAKSQPINIFEILNESHDVEHIEWRKGREREGAKKQRMNNIFILVWFTVPISKVKLSLILWLFPIVYALLSD